MKAQLKGTLLATGALVSALSLAGCGRAGATVQRPPAPEPIKVTTAVAVSQVVPDRLEVTGSLVADENVQVAAERDGRVAALLVERGSFVSKGDVLARLDLTEAKATLDEANASLAWAQAESGRYDELRAKGVVAKAERDRKEIDLDLNRARVVLAQKAYDDCVIRAPFSGLVSEKLVSEGGFIQRGQGVARLVKIDPLRAELAIAESSVSAVKNGQIVTLKVQTFPGQTFEGRIAHIGPSVESKARTLVVEATVPNPKRLLKPGYFVSADIQLPAAAPAVFAPKSAVVSESGVSRLFVMGDDRVAERVVSLGRDLGTLVEIRTGVTAGERVVLTPDRRLTDGLLLQK